MIPDDVYAVVDIDYECFPRPWDEGHILRLLSDPNISGAIYRQHGRILGFCLYEYRERSIALLRLGVAEAWRRQGIATALVTRLVAKLSRDGGKPRTRAELMVSEDLTPCHLFLRARGWVASDKISRDHLGDGRSAYQFAYDLDASAVAHGITAHSDRDC